MRSTVSYAGVQKKGRSQRNPASRGTDTGMSSGGEGSSRDRTQMAQEERTGRRSSRPQQLITFVDSQDPNSRSTIQRHTAHHSNAQRRNARLQSLRSGNRPRILRWTRRQSAEVLPVTTSPAASNSSSSISPLPPVQRFRPPTEDTISPANRPGSDPLLMQTTEVRGRFSPEKESAVQYLIETLCRHAPARAMCEDIVAFARTDEACANILIAYAISLERSNAAHRPSETDVDPAESYLNRGTGLLRGRLGDSINASANANIQAVLLLIAYTADFDDFEKVRIHANALRTMIDQRGGIDEENYPPIIALQLRTIGTSRFFHLTLDCADPCEAIPRFPHGLYNV